MIPVEQRQLYVPGESTGDCWKCCIASILELPYEDVPHFVEQEERGEVASYWNETLAFLRPRGFTFARFGLWGDERPFLLWGSQMIRYAFHAPGHWIASVESPRKTPEGEHISHVVVMNGDKIVFDPHPQRDDGHRGFTEAYLLVAI
jgi:hypothetical protein